MDRIERSAADEATQEARAAADTLAHRICGCATTEQHKADIAAILEYRQAAFNAGRASVLAELESPTEAMVEAGLDWQDGSMDAANQGESLLSQRTLLSGAFTAMIGAYKEAENP